MMDLQKELLESSKQQRGKGGWKASAASLVLHTALIGGIIFMGAQTRHSVAAEKPIQAFITQGAAPPPPPPPPPPKKSSGGQQATPRVQQPKPVVVPQQRNPLTPPVEIPKELPKVDIPVTRNLPVVPDLPVVDNAPVDDGAGPGGDAANGVVGGVEGGVAGGVVGGEIGGQVGGEIGGVKGGELGGKVGGTGTGTEGTGTGGVEAPVVEAPAPPPPPPPPPPVPSGPMRVGGNVKAPTVTDRAEPRYTEAARKARIAGTVIVEAVIDKNGNVDRVKVVKGLPGGLSEQAEAAVRRWKFNPGTMNGTPVDTIFNLTVTFKLE